MKLLIFIFSIFLAANVFAEEKLFITFVKGKVEVKISEKTFTPKIGEEIPENAIINVPKKGSIEITGKEKILNINIAGSYKLKSILESKGDNKFLTTTTTGVKAFEKDSKK